VGTSIHKKQHKKRLLLQELLGFLFLVITTENCCGHLYKQVTKMTSIAELNAAKPVKAHGGRTLDQYVAYTRALAIQTPATGFKEFAPRNPEVHAKYDAMDSSWEGVESSDKAIASGIYALDYASDDRSLRPKTQPKLPPAAPPKTETWFCVVQ
jgi:hypothetical protein